MWLSQIICQDLVEEIADDDGEIAPKARPGPYSRLRPVAKAVALTPTQPAEAPPEKQMAMMVADKWFPGEDPEPIALSISSGVAGLEANIKAFGKLEASLLDQPSHEKLFPVPSVMLSGMPIFKSASEWYFFYCDEGEQGWYLSQELFVRLDQCTNKEILLALMLHIRSICRAISRFIGLLPSIRISSVFRLIHRSHIE